MNGTISRSGAGQVLVENTLSFSQVVASQTNLAGSVLPELAVFHDAATLDQLVLRRTSAALEVLEIQATLNFTLTAL